MHRGKPAPLAIAVAVVERLGLPWDAFRQRLMASIAEDPHRPYYQSWSKALESLVVDMDLATATALDAATPRRRRNVPPCSWMSVTPAVASPTHPVDLDEGADGEAGGAQAGAAGQAIGKPSAR